MFDQLPNEILFQIFDQIDISKVYRLRYFGKIYNSIISSYLEYYWYNIYREHSKYSKASRKNFNKKLRSLIIPQIIYRYGDGVMFKIDKKFYLKHKNKMLKIVTQYAKILSITSLKSKHYIQSQNLKTKKITKVNINRLLLDAYYDINRKNIYFNKKIINNKHIPQRKIRSNEAKVIVEGEFAHLYSETRNNLNKQKKSLRNKNKQMMIELDGYEEIGKISTKDNLISTKKKIKIGSYSDSKILINKITLDKNKNKFINIIKKDNRFGLKHFYQIRFLSPEETFYHASHTWGAGNMILKQREIIKKENINEMNIFILKDIVDQEYIEHKFSDPEFNLCTGINEDIDWQIHRLLDKKDSFKDHIYAYVNYQIIDQL